jgi:hypothetical protein
MEVPIASEPLDSINDPSTFDSSTTNTGGFLADQSGDFKLEFNTEYRAQIYWTR